MEQMAHVVKDANGVYDPVVLITNKISLQEAQCILPYRAAKEMCGTDNVDDAVFAQLVQSCKVTRYNMEGKYYKLHLDGMVHYFPGIDQCASSECIAVVKEEDTVTVWGLDTKNYSWKHCKNTLQRYYQVMEIEIDMDLDVAYYVLLQKQ